ncbi:MAG: manganese efflux pump [Bacteroidales bacterium]|nr:manganese efflux pump [Bacteroidales bacterium]MBR1850687.1 manganese efflux pump [Bacteroidales bacterium]
MTIVETLLLSLALCVDSLVVSAATSFRSHLTIKQAFLMAVIFAICQGLFPLAGAILGDAFSQIIESIDHWIAFALLSYAGGKMIYEGVMNGKGSNEGVIADGKQVSIGAMFLLGIATSIDALAVGIGLGLNLPMRQVMPVVATIALTTLIVAFVGALLGQKRVHIPQRTASIVAGCVLVGLGVKILIEHLTA